MVFGISGDDCTDGQDLSGVLPLINFADAEFLYREGRIEKFIMFAPAEEERQAYIGQLDKMDVKSEDCLIAD